MNRNEYCDRVLAQVGRLTTDEANDLRNELAGHIEDHAEALVEHGYTEEDAAARAVELMGAPEETGKALREQYRHFWLVIVQRIAIFITIVACVQGFFMLPMLSGVYESIRERVSPTVNSISWKELDGAADLHERIPIGDDIVQLNRIEYGVREGERQAVLWVSSYDRIPGRRVFERLIETMSLQSERGETMYGEDGIRYSSCRSSSGSLYVHSGQHTVPLDCSDGESIHAGSWEMARNSAKDVFYWGRIDDAAVASAVIERYRAISRDEDGEYVFEKRATIPVEFIESDGYRYFLTGGAVTELNRGDYGSDRVYFVGCDTSGAEVLRCEIERQMGTSFA